MSREEVQNDPKCISPRQSLASTPCRVPEQLQVQRAARAPSNSNKQGPQSDEPQPGQ